MKKKYLYGIVVGIIAVLLGMFLFLQMGMKYSLNISAGQGYTVTVKDMELDESGKVSVQKGDNVVFAVVLDSNYSDSNLKVMANDTELDGKNGVYRYTVEKDTTIQIEGVTENDYITQGIEMEEETVGEGYILLRDEDKRPIPVLSDISMNSIDRTDIPDLDLTASVWESVNPGWRFRELTAINLGKYEAVKFYAKHSNYLEVKFNLGDVVYARGNNDAWHEFLFQNDEGVMTLYLDGEKMGSCNYLSDLSFCLQDVGAYKFSHIYVIPKDDYKGGMLKVQEGEGYTFDILPREYAIGATLQFHVNIDENFMEGSSFSVKAGGKVLKKNKDGSYSFVFKGDTTISVTGVVPKPLDSRYRVVGIPMIADDMEETDTYILVKSVKKSKTYTYTKEYWGSLPFANIELKEYSNLLFYMKKDDTDLKNYVEILQKADDGTVTSYFAKPDSEWHKVEIKKEGGQMYIYIDGERNDTPIIDAEHLCFVLNTGSQFRITSLLGIKDKNYVPPAPDYISSAYKTIGSPVMLAGEEIDNYELVTRTKDAKTYQFETENWRTFGFADVDMDPYKSFIFFVQKADENTQTWLELYKGEQYGTHQADYISTNTTKWQKVELHKNAKGAFVVYVNDVKQAKTIKSLKEMTFTLSAGSTLVYTSLFGIKDPAYVPPEPDYIDSSYKVITSALPVAGEEISNYELVSKAEGAKTYQFTPPGWRTFGMTEIDMAPYKSLVFFVHKDDVDAKTYLELYKGVQNGAHLADYISTNGNQWYKIELVKTASGTLDVYVNDEKQSVGIASTKDLTFTLSANSTLMYTSVFGIADPTYVEPEPDYIDSAYKTITSALPVGGEEISNYELVSKTEDAKTYQFTPPGWRTFGMAEIDMAPYKSLVFFVHKDDVDAKTYLELYKGVQHGEHLADYISTNNNLWYKIELVKTTSGALDVYVNDEKQSVGIASTKDLTFTLSANSTLMYTSVFGMADPTYVEPEPDYISSEYKAIKEAFDLQGEEISNYELVSRTEDAKTYQYQPENWRGFGLTDIETARYQSLLLFVHKDDVNTSTWLELYKGVVNGEHFADYISTRENQWYKVELVKNDAGAWDVYVNDVKHDTPIANVGELTFTISGGGTLMYTSIFGIADPNYTEPEPIEDVMVVASPWAYHRGSVNPEMTYADGGYEYATVLQGHYTAYDYLIRMMDVDLSLYSELRFAVKTNDYEYVIKDEEQTLFSGRETSWTEYVFRYEENTSGAFGYRVYKAETATDVWLPADANLSELYMQFSWNESAVLYLTELRGIMKEGAEQKLQAVASSFNHYEGEIADTEKPNQLATGSVKVTTTWTSTMYSLTDVALNSYSKLIFYARQYEGSGHFESDYFGTEQLKGVWVEFRLVKNSDDTWNLYRGGRMVTENLAITNLSDVHAKYGNGNYYFSEIFGIGTGTPAPEPDTDPVETVVVQSPWAGDKGSVDNSQTFAAGGYEHATLIPGGHIYYEKIRMEDVDLSVYSEFRLALKTNGNYWYEAGIATNDDYSVLVGANTDWREFVFKYETDASGNAGFHMYKDGSATDVWLPADSNLSDLQMRFSADENAVLYMTELRGTLKKDA